MSYHPGDGFHRRVYGVTPTGRWGNAPIGQITSVTFTPDDGGETREIGFNPKLDDDVIIDQLERIAQIPGFLANGQPNQALKLLADLGMATIDATGANILPGAHMFVPGVTAQGLRIQHPAHGGTPIDGGNTAMTTTSGDGEVAGTWGDTGTDQGSARMVMALGASIMAVAVAGIAWTLGRR